MSDWGVKVSQPGYNVKTCADRELLFSSSFKTLKIEKEGLIVVNPGESGLISHNLGYYPAFIIYKKTGSIWNISSSGYGSIDTSNLNLYVPPVNPITYYYYIFKHRLDSVIDQTNINLTPTSVKNAGDYGLKISKEGKNITNGNIDMNITSGLKTHIIHRSGYGTSTLDDVTISHNLGYIPMHLAYCKKDTDTKVSINFSPAFEYSISTTTTIKIYNYQLDFFGEKRWNINWIYYYLIFKDSI